jgi:hypothetical protein
MWSLLLVGLAHALTPQELVGTWQLDLAASQPVDALLEAAGMGWVERTALAKLPITQVIRIEGAELTVLLDTPVGDRTERLPLAGEVKRGRTKEGEPWELRAGFEGAWLHTTMSVELPEGRRVFTIRRGLEAEGTVLRQKLELVAPGKPPLKADRIFRKVGA